MTAGNCRRLLFYVAILSLVTPFANAQTIPLVRDPEPKTSVPATTVTEYDVATVKKSTYQNGSRIMNTQDGFKCDNVPLKTLIANAYQIDQQFISGGAGWVDATGYDVNAKVAGADLETLKKMTAVERRALLQALLAERFKLKVHQETKELPIYELVVAKSGFKLKPLPPVDKEAEAAKTPEQKRHIGYTMTKPGGYQGQGVTIENLAGNLDYVVNRTVTDKTGLTGIYDIDLKWTPEDGDEAKDSGAEAGPSIFTALQEQLGLKLQPSKGPVETLVIDRAELPTEN